MKTILILCFCLVSTAQLAQSRVQQKSASIGFAYGVTAGRSVVFSKMEYFLDQKDYRAIKKWLSSENHSEIYLSTLVCRILLNQGEITLNRIETKRLETNATSDDELIVRSGCTCSQNASVKELLEGFESCGFNEALLGWLGDMELLTRD